MLIPDVVSKLHGFDKKDGLLVIMLSLKDGSASD